MKDLSIISLSSETNDAGVMYGKFLFHSLSKGQGITIGNTLRRVLLNELGGTAVTGVRFAGIKDEFSTIPGVREDILEIILNLKGIILKKNKINKTTPQFGQIKVKGPAIITANQIILPKGFQLVNPNQYIATITDSNILEFELKLEDGIGYKIANKTLSKKLNNFLDIDAIFMPIHQVNFKIENISDNSKLLKERLLLEIWTNGSITPNEAITLSTNFIINLFDCILKCKPSKEIKINEQKKQFIPKNPHINIAIEELHLSVRAYNCLKKAQINTIGDLLKYSPEKLQELKNFGRKSAKEVFTRLKDKLGITLI